MGASGEVRPKNSVGFFQMRNHGTCLSAVTMIHQEAGLWEHHLPLPQAVASACSFLSLVTISQVYFLLFPWQVQGLSPPWTVPIPGWGKVWWDCLGGGSEP